MPGFKSLLSFWHPVSSGEIAPTPPPTKPEDFGQASSFELLFDRLMDDPEASRGALFPTKSCRS